MAEQAVTKAAEEVVTRPRSDVTAICVKSLGADAQLL